MLTLKYEELTRWENRWIAAAAENASFSKDPSTKVGVVIVGPCGKRRVSEGYNGMPKKICDHTERLENRGFKYPATIHAELNAILFARKDLRFHQLFTTAPPCSACAMAIIQVGITKVVWSYPTQGLWKRWKNEIIFGRALMEEAEIRMTEVI